MVRNLLLHHPERRRTPRLMEITLSRRPYAPQTWLLYVCAVVLLLGPQSVLAQRPLSASELESVGKRIWKNESAGKIEGLTDWNSGENFMSLGIGHFIWYPSGETGPFEESFPPLVQFYTRRGVALPQWLREARHCPWPSRTAFMKDRNSARLIELRALLSSTIKEQVLYIVERLERTTPRYRMAAGRESARVTANLNALRSTSAGTFALIDYINFKGDGLSATEQYKGSGWGLLQVLMEMEPSDPATAPRAFASAAKQVLTRRVENSPQRAKELKWLPGWHNRCDTYAR